MAVSKDEFRRVMGHFATGVTIVTTATGERLHGMTANALCSVSLEPLLVLVCIDKVSHTHPVLSESGIFAVNILSQEQEDLSRFFASAQSAKDHSLAGIPYRFGAVGAPILEGCLAFLECRVVEMFPGGDHTIFIGEVEDAGIDKTEAPLLFYRGRYVRLGLTDVSQNR